MSNSFGPAVTLQTIVSEFEKRDATISRLTSEVTTLQSYKALHQSLAADNAALRVEVERVRAIAQNAATDLISVADEMDSPPNHERSPSAYLRKRGQETLAALAPATQKGIPNV